MTYKSALATASKQTDTQVMAYEKLIAAEYDAAAKAIIAEIERFYGKYLSTTDPKDYYNIAIQLNRLNKLLEQVQKEYVKHATLAGDSIGAASTAAIINQYYKLQYTLSFFSPLSGVEMDFSRIPPELVEISVWGTATKWKALNEAARQKIRDTYGDENQYYPRYGTLLRILVENMRDDLYRIKQAITQAIIAGKSAVKTAKEITDATSVSISNALRIIRTETARQINEAARLAMKQAESEGLPVMKQWLSTLDIKTRGSHQAMDGQKRKADEYFISPNGGKAMHPLAFGIAGEDINCRCESMTIIDGVEPVIRRGRNPVTGENEEFTFRSYPQWAEDNGLKKGPDGYGVPKPPKK